MENLRDELKNKKRVVVKIGSSSLMHEHTGKLNLSKIEKLVRILVDIKNSGKDVILVSSGAIAVGKATAGLNQNEDSLPVKQACAAIGQAKLMMVYQKIFAEYGTIAAQVLITKATILNDLSRNNAKNTFTELLNIGAIPVVNENDTVSTDEIEQVQTFGDNDTLSAIVSSLIEADLLILLSDIDGLYTDDPHLNKNAKFVSTVEHIDKHFEEMGKSTSGSNVGTGGMSAKINAAKIATNSGVDMVITNGRDVENINKIIQGKETGTLFVKNTDSKLSLIEMI